MNSYNKSKQLLISLYLWLSRFPEKVVSKQILGEISGQSREKSVSINNQVIYKKKEFLINFINSRIDKYID